MKHYIFIKFMAVITQYTGEIRKKSGFRGSTYMLSNDIIDLNLERFIRKEAPQILCIDKTQQQISNILDSRENKRNSATVIPFPDQKRA